jgi:type I restriction enzyme, S subunit
VSVKDFSQGHLSLENTRFIPQAEHRALFTRCDPRRGDILLARIGTLGKAVLVDTDVEFSLFVSVALIRFSHDFVNPKFLKIILNSPFVEAEFESIKVGGGTHTNKLNLGDLQTVRILLPPKAEQGRIVAKANELMAFCDQVETKVSNRDTVCKTLLDALLDASNRDSLVA